MLVETCGIVGFPAAALCKPVALSENVSVYPELALVRIVRLRVWLWSANAGRLGSMVSWKAVVSRVKVRLCATTIVLAVLIAANVTAGVVPLSITAGTAVLVAIAVV